MSDFEKKVRYSLIDHGWTMKDVAEELNISVSYLHEIIKGTRKATAQRKRLINLLEITDE